MIKTVEKEPFQVILSPVLADLCLNGEPAQQVDAILELVTDIHSKSVDDALVGRLLECLHTRDADNRIRIQRALVALAAADFPRAQKPEMADWVPAKEEPAGTADRCALAWGDWWAKQFQDQQHVDSGVSCAPTPAPAKSNPSLSASS